jgi:hypothetical protein
MKEPEKIGAFYSYGPHYRRLLKHLRETYPEAEISAFVPSGYPEDFLADLADHVVHTGLAPGNSGGLSGMLALLRTLRRERCGLFVVMFASPKLRLLAALSGARDRRVFPPGGRFSPIRFQPLRMLAGGICRRIRGRIVWWRIRRAVYHDPVEKE